jgi:hypothetical protein
MKFKRFGLLIDNQFLNSFTPECSGNPAGFATKEQPADYFVGSPAARMQPNAGTVWIDLPKRVGAENCECFVFLTKFVAPLKIY